MGGLSAVQGSAGIGAGRVPAVRVLGTGGSAGVPAGRTLGVAGASGLLAGRVLGTLERTAGADFSFGATGPVLVPPFGWGLERGGVCPVCSLGPGGPAPRQGPPGSWVPGADLSL